jgi:hypothetical protein
MNHKTTEEERQIRKERVLYIYFKLKEKNPKVFIESFIKKQGITSESTARRIFTDAADWKKSEIDLFIATYTPTKSDSEAIEEVLGINTSKVSNEVIEEPVSDNIQIEEELKYGDTVEFEGKKYKFVETSKFTSDDCQMCDLFAKHIIDEEVCICSNYAYNVMGYFEEIEIEQEEDKCTECEIEAAHIINELSAKNQELQKELHTSKNVITTLQKGIEELNEDITESKIIIAEICKERDDKDEEIRVLRLDLIRKDNDMDKLEEDFTEAAVKYENLLEVLETKKLSIELNPKYDSLYKVLLAAYNQASNGKGKERHQLNDEEHFENQKICEIARRLSIDYNLGQAVKKIYESKRLTNGRDVAELYGAINYIAAAIIVKQEEKQNG